MCVCKASVEALPLLISRSPINMRREPIHHFIPNRSWKNIQPISALAIKLVAVFMTVASSEDEHSCRDLVKHVHIRILHTNISPKQTICIYNFSLPHKETCTNTSQPCWRIMSLNASLANTEPSAAIIPARMAKRKPCP